MTKVIYGRESEWEIYTREGKIDAEKERLQGDCVVEHIMTVEFEVV